MISAKSESPQSDDVPSDAAQPRLCPYCLRTQVQFRVWQQAQDDLTQGQHNPVCAVQDCPINDTEADCNKARERFVLAELLEIQQQLNNLLFVLNNERGKP